MKSKDNPQPNTIHCTTYQSIDVSQFPEAVASLHSHIWTFNSTIGDDRWTYTARGEFRTCARQAVNDFCLSHLTKYARLVLIGASSIDQQ